METSQDDDNDIGASSHFDTPSDFNVSSDFDAPFDLDAPSCKAPPRDVGQGEGTDTIFTWNHLPRAPVGYFPPYPVFLPAENVRLSLLRMYYNPF